MHCKLYHILHELSLLACIVFVDSGHSSPENILSKPIELYEVTDTSKQISSLFGLFAPQ